MVNCFRSLLGKMVLQIEKSWMSTGSGVFFLIKSLTDESAIDVQVQELENLFGVMRSVDEGSFVDWAHSE